MPIRGKYWYQRRNLKHVTGFLSAEKKKQLRRIAKTVGDMTLTRYVTRLLERHIKENTPS